MHMLKTENLMEKLEYCVTNCEANYTYSYLRTQTRLCNVDISSDSFVFCYNVNISQAAQVF